MASLDVFTDDAFGLISMTEAIERIPYAPSMIGGMGLFEAEAVSSLTVMIEDRSGQLSLVPTAARGTTPTWKAKQGRNVRPIAIPHIPLMDAIEADDVQGIRAFGTESEVETVAGLVNQHLAEIRADFEATWEWHRIGALKGIVLDADGTTEILDIFDLFGITQTTVSFNFTDTGTYGQPDPQERMKAKCLEVYRAIQSALGGTMFTGVTAICGDQFFDRLVSHATVEKAHDQQFMRVQQANVAGNASGFMFGGILWLNYRGAVGVQAFVETDEAWAFPTGVRNLFKVFYGPANFAETVNTPGKPIYVKQERKKFDTGVEIFAQSNPLHLCRRPKALIHLTDVTPFTLPLRDGSTGPNGDPAVPEPFTLDVQQIPERKRRQRIVEEGGSPPDDTAEGMVDVLTGTSEVVTEQQVQQMRKDHDQKVEQMKADQEKAQAQAMKQAQPQQMRHTPPAKHTEPPKPKE